MFEDYWLPKEVADKADITPDAVWWNIREHKLNAIQIANRYLVPDKDARRFIEEHQRRRNA